MSSPTETRLNLGCGLDYRAGYLNVDLHPGAVADQIGAALSLDLQARQLQELLLRDVIEHLGYCSFSRLLWRARRWLRPDGEILIETPDIDACVEAYAAAPGSAEREDVLCHIYGIEDPGMSHLFCFPAELLRTMLEASGFEVVALERFAERPLRPSLRCRARRRESEQLDQRCALLDTIAGSDEITIRYADFKYFEEMAGAVAEASDAHSYQALLPEHAVTSAKLSAMLHARRRPGLEPLLGPGEYARILTDLERQADVEIFVLLADQLASGVLPSFRDAREAVGRLLTGAPAATPECRWRSEFHSDFFTRESFSRFVAHLHARATQRGDAELQRALRMVDTER